MQRDRDSLPIKGGLLRFPAAGARKPPALPKKRVKSQRCHLREAGLMEWQVSGAVPSWAPGGHGGAGKREGTSRQRRKDWAMHTWVRPGGCRMRELKELQEPQVETPHRDVEGRDGARRGGRATVTAWDFRARTYRGTLGPKAGGQLSLRDRPGVGE